MHPFRYSFLLLLFTTGLFAQGSLTCVGSSTSPALRAEGLAERAGDIVLNCAGGAPNSTININLQVFVNTSVTNRQMPDGSTDVQLLINGGPANSPARISGANSVTFLGLTLVTNNQGALELRLSNLRVDATRLAGPGNNLVLAFISISGTTALPIANPQLNIGVVQASLLAGASGVLVCSQSGSPLPQLITFSGLASTAAHASNRVTEGFGSALVSRGDVSNQNADSGIRVIVRYGGFPVGARLFVPDAITGSSATAQTSAGDFGVNASGGTYTPGRSQLLLIRVNNPRSDGSGGTLALPVPTAVTTFDAASELSLAAGSALAVYEVVDSNPAALENAHLPAFLGAAPGGPAAVTSAVVGLGAISDVNQSSTSAPVPRFVGTIPPPDCTTVGDCSASYYPRLTVALNGTTDDLQLTPANATGFVVVQNSGGGVLSWTATTAASFLAISPASGTNNGGFRVDANATGLAAGAYRGTVVVDAGPIAGTRTIAVTLTVPAAEQVTPVIRSIGNAADPTLTAIVPGSLTSIFGTRLNSPSSVTFNGQPGKVIYFGDTQINVQVPTTLTGSTAAVRVASSSVTSAAYTANVSLVAPAIFVPGILNQDWHVNDEATPAPVGSTIMIYATGLPSSGAIQAKIHDRLIDLPTYAGPAPGIDGVQQVNVAIPADLPAMQTWAYVCSGGVCSAPVKLWIGR